LCSHRIPLAKPYDFIKTIRKCDTALKIDCNKNMEKIKEYQLRVELEIINTG
jgi:hypothetical protein